MRRGAGNLLSRVWCSKRALLPWPRLGALRHTWWPMGLEVLRRFSCRLQAGVGHRPARLHPRRRQQDSSRPKGFVRMRVVRHPCGLFPLCGVACLSVVTTSLPPGCRSLGAKHLYCDETAGVGLCTQSIPAPKKPRHGTAITLVKLYREDSPVSVRQMLL